MKNYHKPFNKKNPSIGKICVQYEIRLFDCHLNHKKIIAEHFVPIKQKHINT
jgi:hypothetical protein